LRENHRQIIIEQLGRAVGNGYRVLEHLYEHPIVSVSDVGKLTAISYPAANELVTRLADCGILCEFTGQSRNRRFIYQKYIELFYDGDEEQRS
jgi:DNA-binding MarR family transcriptional regulator